MWAESFDGAIYLTSPLRYPYRQAERVVKIFKVELELCRIYVIPICFESSLSKKRKIN